MLPVAMIMLAVDIIIFCCRFVLRNHIAQKAVEMAENGDYSEVHR